MEMRPYLEKWLQTWSEGTADELAEFYHEDVYYSDPARPHGITNKAELVSYFEKLLPKFKWRWEVVEIFDQPQGCLLKWKTTVVKEEGNYSFYGLDIIELAGEKITRNEVYFDSRML